VDADGSSVAHRIREFPTSCRHGVQAGHRGRIDGRDGVRIPQTAAIHGAVIDPVLCEVEIGKRARRGILPTSARAAASRRPQVPITTTAWQAIDRKFRG
jgi:hypothetical protein